MVEGSEFSRCYHPRTSIFRSHSNWTYVIEFLCRYVLVPNSIQKMPILSIFKYYLSTLRLFATSCWCYSFLVTKIASLDLYLLEGIYLPFIIYCKLQKMKYKSDSLLCCKVMQLKNYVWCKSWKFPHILL